MANVPMKEMSAAEKEYADTIVDNWNTYVERINPFEMFGIWLTFFRQLASKDEFRSNLVLGMLKMSMDIVKDEMMKREWEEKTGKKWESEKQRLQ